MTLHTLTHGGGKSSLRRRRLGRYLRGLQLRLTGWIQLLRQWNPGGRKGVLLVGLALLVLALYVLSAPEERQAMLRGLLGWLLR
jgi:hypothetical protein